MTTERDAAPEGLPRPVFESLLRTVEEMAAPDGFRAELIRGKIIVSTWPGPRSLRCLRVLRERIAAHAPQGHVVDAAPVLFRFPSPGRAYGPSLFSADEAAFEADGRSADGSALSLVAESTSVSTRDADWVEKLEVYGRLVPVYLVVDMQESEITCFSDPSPHGYRSRQTVPFGKPLTVAEPFGFEFDTAGFRSTS
ncbi:Uma2 family endonuclease [Streptomyces globosus]|uniref:Uma2 family endonuclease n=1 Tax=Streptomyces sp. WAC05292 TaxID=2487418 RepID=UPI000F740429|nr:Uma2 family endonuclease [Streptomyces sp. WAC05292]RSS85527.1 Uma2 family endonuclease [Streptomyces sp. WAC05292]